MGMAPNQGNPGRARIVKSMAVVDDRAGQSAPVPAAPEQAKHGVIKKHHVDHGVPAAQGPQLPARDAYLDELNRLRVEIRQCEEELKALGRDISSAKRAKDAHLSSIESATDSAADIVARAEFKASQIITDAQQEGLRLMEQAKNDGYLEGFHKGYEESVQEFKAENEPVAVEIADLLDALSEYRRTLLSRQGSDLIDLVIAVSRKVIGDALETGPAAIASMLKGIVEAHNREEYIKIILSPELVPIKASAGDEVRALLESMARNVTVTVDRDAAAGTVLVETPGGLVDASIATQLDNLTALLQSDLDDN